MTLTNFLEAIVTYAATLGWHCYSKSLFKGNFLLWLQELKCNFSKRLNPYELLNISSSVHSQSWEFWQRSLSQPFLISLPYSWAWAAAGIVTALLLQCSFAAQCLNINFPSWGLALEITFWKNYNYSLAKIIGPLNLSLCRAWMSSREYWEMWRSRNSIFPILSEKTW